MGSMPRLKIKDEIRYRKGSTDDSQNCRCCVEFVNLEPDAPVQYNAPGMCRIIGLRDLVRYRVRGDHRCDRQRRMVMGAWWCGVCKTPWTHGETECPICKFRFKGPAS